MISFVYLGVGRFRDIPVFKIGKARHPKRRTANLGIKLVGYFLCVDDIEAFAMENAIRQRIRAMGGRNVGKTSDWFHYKTILFQEVQSWFKNDIGDLDAILARVFQNAGEFAFLEDRIETLEKLLAAKNKIISMQEEIIQLLKKRTDSPQKHHEEMMELVHTYLNEYTDMCLTHVQGAYSQVIELMREVQTSGTN